MLCRIAGRIGLALILSLPAGAAQKPKGPAPLRPVGERSVAIPGNAVAVFALDGQWGVLTSAPSALLLVSSTGETVKTISLDEFEGRDAVSDGKAIYVRHAGGVMEISPSGEKEVSANGALSALIRGPGDNPWGLSKEGSWDVKVNAKLSSMAFLEEMNARNWIGVGDELWVVSEKGWMRVRDNKRLSPPPPGELKAALGDLLLVVKDGKFRPFSLKKNDFIWSRKLPSPMREAFGLGGAIYMASEDGLLHRFTVPTGFENATYDLQQRGPLLKAEWAGKLMIAPLEGRTVTALSAEAKPERLIILALHQRIMGMAASGERLALLVQGRDDKYTLELYHH